MMEMMDVSNAAAPDDSNMIAVLVLSYQQPHIPLMDLSSQHFDALSSFADNHRQSTKLVALKGPLVGRRIVQSITRDSWPQLQMVHLVDPDTQELSPNHLRRSGIRVISRFYL